MMNRKFVLSIGLALFCLFGTRAQILKNADYSELPEIASATAQDGMLVKYVNFEGKIVRSLTGKEFTYEQKMLDILLNGLDAGWINSPNWKKKYAWKLTEGFEAGLYREKKDDDGTQPVHFSVNSIIQPSKGHPLYQYFINQNDSLYQPSGDVANTREYLIKVQNFENNSPRLSVTIHVNDPFSETSISEFKEMDYKLKLKTPHKVYQRNDSIWFKDGDIISQENNELKYQKNTLYIIIGHPEKLNFAKGITEGFSEYTMEAGGKTDGTNVNRLDQVMIELTGHPQSIQLFLDKINWKEIDKAFKYKLK